VPFALIGGIVALWVTGIHLSVSAAIGFIALFGQAVLNGVVMVRARSDLRVMQNLSDALSDRSWGVSARRCLGSALSTCYLDFAIYFQASMNVLRFGCLYRVPGRVDNHSTVTPSFNLGDDPTLYGFVAERNTVARNKLQRLFVSHAIHYQRFVPFTGGRLEATLAHPNPLACARE
jgi:hypothetical protein